MSQTNCVPADVQDSALDPTDDALELDAPDSDVDGADTSTNTVILASDRAKSLTSPKANGPLESKNCEKESTLKSPSFSSRRRRPSDVGPSGDISQSEEQPSKRRRNWGRSSSKGSTVSSTETPSSEGNPDTHRGSSRSTDPQPARTSTDATKKACSTDDMAEKKKHDGSESTSSKAASPSNKESRASHSKSKDTESHPAEKQADPEGRTSPKKAQQISPKRKGPKETKAVGYLVEAPERVHPSEPAQYTPSDIVYIRSLVRPFTADQLRQMIATHYGPVTDLWLDRIKSTSVVRLDSIETATKCRDGLDGSRWPSMNPHTLRCDFGTDVLFSWIKEHGNTSAMPPPKHLFLGQTEPSPVADRLSKRRATDGDTVEDSSTKHRDSRYSDARHRADEASSRGKPPTDSDKPPEAKNKPDEPAKLLDDLFRKTTAAPSVYWLPLTQEEAKKQEEERIKLFTSKRITAQAITQRATRSPFTSPAGADQNRQANSPLLERSKAEQQQQQGNKEAADAPRKEQSNAPPVRRKSPSQTEDRRRPVRPQEDSAPRRRERSPFTPERRHPTGERQSSNKARDDAQRAPYASRRNRSPSPNYRRPVRRPVRRSTSSSSASSAASRRRVRSRSRSSTGPRRRGFPRRSPRFGRPRSIDRRRPVSPLAARSRR